MSGLKIGPKPVGLAARKAEAAKKDTLAVVDKLDFSKVNPKEMQDRLGIVFDDSSSMCGFTDRSYSEKSNTKIVDARGGVEEFLRNCKPMQTSVTIYPMNMTPMPLTADLITLSQAVHAIEATGGTPLLETLLKMVKAEPLTRAIVFSDGECYHKTFNETVKECRERKVPVDTVYFGGDDRESINFMRSLAEATGGVFLHFDPAKINFRNAFKYLSPGYYGMLADKTVISDIESGKRA